MMNQLQSLTDNELALATKLASTELELLNAKLEHIHLAGPQAEAKLRVLMQEQERRAGEKESAERAKPVAEAAQAAE